MPTNLRSTIIMALWPPARRKAREQEAEAQRQAEQAEKAACEDARAEALRQHAQAQHVRAYKAHIQAVNLNTVGERDGRPLKLSDLRTEVERRLDLAAAVGGDRQIKLAEKMSDQEIAAITGKLDPTALRFFVDHDDPERQRTAAKTILDARANLPDQVPLGLYATIIAEAIARLRVKSRRDRAVAAVIIRAILLRSADPRWQQQRKGVMCPLSGVPYA